jgi:hypothetical protein
MPPRTNIAEKLATAAEQGGQVRQVKLAFAEYLSARTAFVNTIVVSGWGVQQGSMHIWVLLGKDSDEESRKRSRQE